MEKPAERTQVAPGTTELDPILESAHEAFVSMDESGRIVAWNGEAERTFGWPKEEAIGRRLRDVVVPEAYRDRHDAGLRRFLEDGTGPLLGKRVEISALHRSGREFPVELTISAVRERGRWMFHAFVHDIGERYRLTEVQARLATLVEHSADAIVSRTRDGIVTSWNPGAEELFGYSAEEMLGRTLDRLVPHHRAGEADRLIGLVLAGQPVRSFETERVRKDGRTIDVSVTISPIRDDGGDVRELSMIARDIGMSKKAERALARAYSELERVSELKSRFVAIASHELRTPLTSIRGFATTLRERWPALSENDKHSFVGMIDAQAARLHRTVDDLLTLSRIEAGRLTGAPAPVEIEPLARLVARELGIEGETTVESARPGIARADPDHVHRILVNYLANARAYGAPPYVVSARDHGDSVVVAVADSGSGVPPSLVPHLFESFARGPSSAGGTGLGLAIVKGLAEASGGTAWFEPNEPAGSRFCVSLPRG